MIPEIHSKDINKFKELLRKWINIYKWQEISYIAINTLEGPILVSGRILFDTSKTASPFKFESEHIVAGREVLEVSTEEIQEIVESAIAGKLSIYEYSIPLAPEDTRRYSFYFDPSYHPPIQFGPRFPSLQIQGEQRHRLISKIGNTALLDWELQAADTPFYNLDELLTNIGLPGLLQLGDSTRLEVVVRWPGMIVHTSTIEKGNGWIQCQAASGIDVKEMKLGYKILLPTSIERGHLLGDDIKWEKDGDFQIGTANIEVGDAPLIQVFLSYKGELLHSWWVSDPQKHLNLRYAIYETFDDGAKLLNQFLLEPKRDSEQFEIGFSILLNLLGFSTSHHGLIPKLQEGPDILAITPGGKIAIVECTTGLLDEKDKLAKLVQRTTLIRDKLKVSGYGHILIQPVIVTALTRDNVSAHIEEANKHKIVIVCREDIDALLKQIALPPDADVLYQQAVQTISGSDQESLF